MAATAEIPYEFNIEKGRLNNKWQLHALENQDVVDGTQHVEFKQCSRTPAGGATRGLEGKGLNDMLHLANFVVTPGLLLVKLCGGKQQVGPRNVTRGARRWRTRVGNPSSIEVPLDPEACLKLFPWQAVVACRGLGGP